jgi:hypothetical protein
MAEELHAPLDVIVVRKLGVPVQPEYGFGLAARARWPSRGAGGADLEDMGAPPGTTACDLRPCPPPSERGSIPTHEHTTRNTRLAR